jgi:aromatic-L-amino-acid decarboxylase
LGTSGISGEGSAEEILISAAREAGRAIDERRLDPVSAAIDEKKLIERLDAYDFRKPRPVDAVIRELAELLRHNGVRSDHPRYFGLFNPPALPSAVAGDLLASAVNPQLAVWGHAPAAVEIERKLVRCFGSAIWGAGDTAGSFTSGGTEANATALLSALATRLPGWAEQGVSQAPFRPTLYASEESHLAWIKIARMAGLGSDAVRLVPADKGLAMTGAALASMLEADLAHGWRPVLVVATAGTTAHGAIDEIGEIADVARAHGTHVHVDAAWAGGALLHAEHAKLLAGIERADSVTIDSHKWLSVPMGAGLFLARDWDGLTQAFSVATGYMPSASGSGRDLYIHSMQWSRRFIGAKLFVAMATLGFAGYRALIDRSFALADTLREHLSCNGWLIRNATALPLVCFEPSETSDEKITSIAEEVVASGSAWISTVRLQGRLVLRACITSYETTDDDVEQLVDALNRARSNVT